MCYYIVTKPRKKTNKTKNMRDNVPGIGTGGNFVCAFLQLISSFPKTSCSLTNQMLHQGLSQYMYNTTSRLIILKIFIINTCIQGVQKT